MPRACPVDPYGPRDRSGSTRRETRTQANAWENHARSMERKHPRGKPVAFPSAVLLLSLVQEGFQGPAKQAELEFQFVVEFSGLGKLVVSPLRLQVLRCGNRITGVEAAQ